MNARVFLCASLLVFASSASSQTPPAPAPLAVSVDVKVVNVDVSVTDGKGKPVNGLTRDDFEVIEDGQPQTVTNFSMTERKVRSGDAAAPHQQPGRRKIIVLVDNNYIDARERALTLDTLDRFVNDRFDVDSEWALAAIGQSLEILQPLTSDLAAIHSAVAKARRSGTVSLRSEIADRDILADPFRRMEKGAGYDYEGTVRFQAREQTQQNARAFSNTAAGLTEAARAYSGVDGKKIIVLLTGGMEMNTSFAAYDSDRDREMQDRKLAISKVLESIVREVNGGNMSIFVVNVRPPAMAAPQHDIENQAWGGRVTGSSTDKSDISDVNSAAFTLAASTGGLSFASAGIGDALDTVDSMSSNYYSIGYSPQHREDGAYHSITVRLKKPNLQAVYRHGYLDVSPDEQLEQYLRLRISAMQPSKSVPVNVNTESSSDASGKPVLQLTAAMPWEKVTLLRNGEQYKGRVHVYLSIFDRNGKNVGFHHRIQDLVLTPIQYAQAIAGAFRYRMAVRLNTGEFTVAMTLRDDLSREIGTGVKKLRL